jgi:regulation of enolase protein 1 (concanavalin A-like superfamily)
MRSTERGTVLFWKKHIVTPPNHHIKAHLTVIKVKPSTGFWRLTIYDESSYPYVTTKTLSS